MPSAWASNGAQDLEAALLEVRLNGQPQGEAALFARDADGVIYASRASLEAWRMRQFSSRTVVLDGETYYALGGVNGLTATVDEATQSLDISALATLFNVNDARLDGGETGPMTTSAWGGFLNYDVYAQHGDGDTIVSGFFEAGVYSPHGYGTTRFLMPGGRDGAGLVRLETSWSIDDPERMRSLRVGDGITRGGIGGTPLRFSGVQFARNFAVQPGFITLPMPTVGGSAALPSTVDVYVNNALRGSQDVPAGPFQITDVPVMTGAGDVRLVVRDALGRETVTTQSYFASTQILRRGLHDYSYEVGFLRQDYARRSNSYGDLAVSATHRYGFTDRLTGEAHLEATADQRMASLSAGTLLPGVGVFTVSAAASQGDKGTGGMVGLGFESLWRTVSFGARTELTTRNYDYVGLASDRRAVAQTTQVYAGLPTSFGSVNLNYLYRDSRDDSDVEMAGASAMFRIGDIGALNLTAQQSLSGQKNTMLGAYLSIPLGPRRTASTRVQHTGGRTSLGASLQQNLPEGEGMGYRADVERGADERLYGQFSYQTDFGRYDVEATRTNGKAAVRATVSGSVGLIEGDVFTARRLEQSFAAVKVGEVKGVQVYAENQPVAKTNSKGVAIIPRLRPYEKNTVRIEQSDLPLDLASGAFEKTVRPYNRSGVIVEFAAELSHGALMTVLQEDGSPLPAGAKVRVAGSKT
ncbi:MAG TPA: fimbria/pilus outer membrane usher protein, partial [Pedomonas sp.]|uniref:fimbria/pilus outer membrane usher protein n=1 Tax=Pedomonas sp. TaxID=2976421 RepID=UPI002F416BE6